MKNSPSIRTYYVDESGDATIFNRRGQVLIGEQGCSRYFILGVLDIENAVSLQQELDELRASLLADPYFKDVPSMQLAARKTALKFHAKDDLPEVRRDYANTQSVFWPSFGISSACWNIFSGGVPWIYLTATTPTNCMITWSGCYSRTFCIKMHNMRSVFLNAGKKIARKHYIGL